MVSASGDRLSRPEVVVSRTGRDFAGVPARGIAVPTLRRSDCSSGAGRAFDILLQALPEIGGQPEIQTQFNSSRTGGWRESTCCKENPSTEKAGLLTVSGRDGI